MTDFDVIAAVFVIVGFLATILGLVVLTNLIVLDVLDRRRRRAQTDVDHRRQEREAQRHLRVGTGRIQAVPIDPPVRLVPFVDEPESAA